MTHDPHEYDLAPVDMPGQPAKQSATGQPVSRRRGAAAPASRPAAAGNTAGKAAGYVLMVLIMLAGAAAAFWGFQAYQNTPEGGTVYGLRIETRPGISGAAANFKFWGDVDHPYLRVNPRDEGDAEIVTPVKKDTTIGNGLYWALEPREVRDFRLVEVWDDETFGDELVDRINIEGVSWQAEGQQFVVKLVGVPTQPEPWALPMIAAGITAVLLMIGVFLWTAAI